MPSFVDDAVVLRHWEFSETSQTVVLLTRGHGTVRGLAKGSKRATEQRFSGGFEVLTRGELVAISKPTTELATLTEWDLRVSCGAFRRSLLAHRAGMYLVDLARHAISDAEPHPEAYDALVAAMDSIGADSSRGSIAVCLVRYQWLLLVASGYEPRLAVEGVRDGERYVFLPALGVLGERGGGGDGRGDGESWGVRAETVRVLLAVREGDWEVVEGLESPVVGRAARLLSVYWRSLLGRELPTRPILFGGGERRG